MAPSMTSRLSQLWPFSLLKTDDLKTSDRLVSRTSVSENAKEFLFAIPEKKSVVYILAVQNLSEQSIRDAEHVIKKIQPDAVVAQVAPASLPELLDGKERSDNLMESVPTSSYGVLRRCFNDKFDRTKYEKLAGSLILREIFGTDFHGHVLVSKRAAEEVDAEFLLLEFPDEGLSIAASHDNKTEDHSKRSLIEASSCLLPRSASTISSSTQRLSLSDPVQLEMLKIVSQSLSLSMPKLVSGGSDGSLKHGSEDAQPIPSSSFQVPCFAQVVYQLLADLHDIFFSLPSIKIALTHAQKMLVDINEGVPIDVQHVKEVHSFRVAIEGLRIALNGAGRIPLQQLKENEMEFELLSQEEKCHAMFTQALRSQASCYKTMVAIVDAGTLASMRRHWNTTIPPEFSLLAKQGFIRLSEELHASEDGMLANVMDRRRHLAETSMVAVGAGATAALGASSLSKALPASTLVKLVSYKIPTILKIGFAHVQRSAAIGLGKILTSSKVIAPGVGSKVSGLKVSSSAENIRGVTHGFIASVQRTSLYAMRTSFYEIMRKRNIRPLRFAPWATFVGSTATCAGLLAYGDAIECVAESLPSAPVIASWGRGLESLHHASEQIGQANLSRVQEAMQSFMYNLKKK